MSDNTGDRPADQTPQDPQSYEPAAPAEAAAPAAPAEAAEPAAPAASAAPSAASGSAPAATPNPGPPAAPGAAPAAPSVGGYSGRIPPRPAPPGAAPTGAQPVYAPPAGYGRGPASPSAPAHPGAAHGAAFGVGPGQVQPTLPIGAAPATGAVATAEAPRRRSPGRVVGLIVAAALVGGAAGLGGAWVGVNLFSPTGTAPAAGPVTVTVNDTESVNQTTAIAAKVVPSVVTIAASSGSGSGTGSGVVLSDDGYVVTNTHVVTLDGATGDAAIRVTTSEGRVFDAEVVGTDPTYDLAVIKLEGATDLTPIDFADSSELNVGDTTIAVGAPLGLSNTVTTGIVSALNRSIEIASSAAPDSSDTNEDDGESDGGQTPPFQFDFGQGQSQSQSTESIKIAVIQTDAAINPGNSGGALVDADGALIGINVAIASAGSSSGQAGSIGVGFAIPSDVVERVTGEIIESGSASHGLLGASVVSAAALEDADITGAYIDSVVDGGAAAAAGLQSGDIVTGFNGVPITDSVDLTAQVRAAAAGSDATVTYVRDGETRTVDVTLGALDQ
ncbi:S1C family serine protease [Microbacterium hominis]|uniref:Trypsin-like peptidase domain-containing protein n=1 Tax=Microbacterium hominis TaxID=162426 RepID=A0A7D4U7D8_9MICO|nr:trypsin-like peptidase domain-containing protein [Microbacterium hominis]QKJ19146.1 trypsin-like peptidase domain-containing protein [Microbacterium hominis]